MIQVNGILIGANSVVLSIITSYPEHTVVYYDKYDNNWTSIKCIENQNFFFRESAWEIDLEEIFEPGEDYQIYVQCNNDRSDKYDIRMEQNGNFGEYEVHYVKDWKNREAWNAPYETKDAIEGEDGLVTTFIKKLENIGFDIKYFKIQHRGFEPNFYICKTIDSAGRCNGIAGDCGFSTTADIHTYIHEYRHCFYFCQDWNAECGNAKDIQEEIFKQMNEEAYYTVFSLFSVNENKTEPYVYYGENSCENNYLLYDYFILKLIALNPITFIDSNNNQYKFKDANTTIIN